MSMKIKSITAKFPIDTISFNQLTTTQIDELSEKQLQALQILAGESGKIEYEPELLKRPDGSLITEPPRQLVAKSKDERHKDESDMLWVIEFFYNNHYKNYLYEVVQLLDVEDDTFIDFNANNSKHQEALLEGRVFLPEDKHLAEKKAAMLSKQTEIQYEIDRLNALDCGEKRYFLILNDSGEVTMNLVFNLKIHQIKNMYKKTAETILKKYSQEELKQYLGIII